MNNNLISLVFNLTGSALDVMEHAIKSGILMASSDKTHKRMEMCISCTHFEPASVRCKLCGCYMNTKIRFDGAKCPIGKW